jgi:ribonuclease HI
MAASETHLVAYADGSCIGNPGPGGWGVLILDPDGSERELSGGDPSTTNNRMEITAAIEALRAVASGVEMTIRSDSQYVVKTMTLGWKRRENVDLWQQLDAEAAQRKVNFEWVRGHAGDPHNERADELANRAATEAAKAGRDIFTRGASAAAAKAARAVRNDENEAELTRMLEPLLAEGETLARCGGCGRMFVLSPFRAAPLSPRQPGSMATSAPVTMPYCSLASCQLKARRSSKM